VHWSGDAELVVDELAEATAEDDRPRDQARPMLLSLSDRELPHAAIVWNLEHCNTDRVGCTLSVSWVVKMEIPSKQIDDHR
jgi:hypothetical protein